MSKITISMPDTMSEYVSERVADGQYGNVSEYFRDLVRKEQAERRLTRDELRKVLDDAAASGMSSEQVPDIIARLKARLRADGRL